MTALILTIILVAKIAQKHPKTRINLISKVGIRNTIIASFLSYTLILFLARLVLTV